MERFFCCKRVIVSLPAITATTAPTEARPTATPTTNLGERAPAEIAGTSIGTLSGLDLEQIVAWLHGVAGGDEEPFPKILPSATVSTELQLTSGRPSMRTTSPTTLPSKEGGPSPECVIWHFGDYQRPKCTASRNSISLSLRALTRRRCPGLLHAAERRGRIGDEAAIGSPIMP